MEKNYSIYVSQRNCLDNYPIENFLANMKHEIFYGHEFEFTSLHELQSAMEEYVKYHNHQRITTILKGLTPVQVKNQSLLTA